MRPVDRIASRILLVRGQKVMVDADLAALYGVTTKRLNEQIKRNPGRFPGEFAFRLTREEKREVVAKCDHLANLRFASGLPLAFTEHGALMASAVLNTSQAVEVSLYVIRAFLQMRESLDSHKALARQLEALERKVGTHDRAILEILQAIRHLTQPPEAPRRKRIGFV